MATIDFKNIYQRLSHFLYIVQSAQKSELPHVYILMSMAERILRRGWQSNANLCATLLVGISAADHDEFHDAYTRGQNF